MSAEVPAENGMARAIAQIDAAADEAAFHAGLSATRIAITLQARARAPEATLAAAWSGHCAAVSPPRRGSSPMA